MVKVFAPVMDSVFIVMNLMKMMYMLFLYK